MLLRAIDGLALSAERAALFCNRSLAASATERATVKEWRSLAREHNRYL